MASIIDGRQEVATAGTRVRLTSQAVSSIAITAETDNTGTVVVGGSTVVAAQATRRGTPLSAGQTISIDTDDVADIYIDSTVNTDGVTFTAVATS